MRDPEAAHCLYHQGQHRAITRDNASPSDTRRRAGLVARFRYYVVNLTGEGLHGPAVHIEARDLNDAASVMCELERIKVPRWRWPGCAVETSTPRGKVFRVEALR